MTVEKKENNVGLKTTTKEKMEEICYKSDEWNLN